LADADRKSGHDPSASRRPADRNIGKDIKQVGLAMSVEEFVRA
jgi:hypothetical protein